MALKLTQRADILVEGCSVVDITRAGIQMASNNHVAVVFKNFGRTRAENVVYKITLIIPGVPDSDQVNGPGTLGAGDTETLSFIPFGSFLTPQTAKDIGSGKIVMRVKGTVSYTDIFGDDHDFEFSLDIAPSSKYFVMRRAQTQRIQGNRCKATSDYADYQRTLAHYL